MLDISTIYTSRTSAPTQGAQVLARFPDADRVEVSSHQDIPGLYGNAGNVRDWVKTKRGVLVLGTKKSLTARANGRSSDFIAPSTSNGCAMACNYCYVPRRKGYANPVTVFVNIERILGYLKRHVARQGPKKTANQCDPVDWVYDIGENGDCSVDARSVRQRARPGGPVRPDRRRQGSFATKFVNRDLLDYDPRGGTRVRFSLMPAEVARVTDLRTSRISERIAAIDDFVEAGYEVHLNFSPVIVQEGWLDGWARLFDQIDAGIGEAAKRQLACEVIMLTHNPALHQVNLGWHPRGEELIWRPDIQEAKRSQSGQANVRYRTGWKGQWVTQLTELMAERMPYCRVRYAF